MYGNGVCQLDVFASSTRKTYAETQYKVKTPYIHFSSCMYIILDNIMDWWANDFRYRATSSQIHIAYTVTAQHLGEGGRQAMLLVTDGKTVV
jgi:hypothetical protein